MDLWFPNGGTWRDNETSLTLIMVMDAELYENNKKH